MGAVRVTLVTAGSDVGPLIDIYTDADCFFAPIESNVTVSDFLGLGYVVLNVPTGATKIRLQSKGTCTNYVDLTIT
jgi:hypothetical protein